MADIFDTLTGQGSGDIFDTLVGTDEGDIFDTLQPVEPDETWSTDPSAYDVPPAEPLVQQDVIAPETPPDVFDTLEPETPPEPKGPQLKQGKLSYFKSNLLSGMEQVVDSVAGSIRGFSDFFQEMDKKALAKMPEDAREDELARREGRSPLAKAITVDQKDLSKLSKNMEKFIEQSGSDFPELMKREGVKGWVDEATKMVPQVVAQGATHALTGGAGSVLFMGSQILGGKYNKLVDEDGIEPIRAFQAALGDAAMQAPMEAIGMGKALSVWKPGRKMGKLFKEVAGSMGVEFVTEWMQAYPDAATEIWAKAKQENKSTSEQVDQFFNDFWNTTKAGMYEGSIAMLFGGASPIAKAATDKVSKEVGMDAIDLSGLQQEPDTPDLKAKIEDAALQQIDTALGTESITPEAALKLTDNPTVAHLRPQVEALIKKHGVPGKTAPDIFDEAAVDMGITKMPAGLEKKAEPKTQDDARIAEEDAKVTRDGVESVKSDAAAQKQIEAKADFIQSAGPTGHAATAESIAVGDTAQVTQDLDRGIIDYDQALAMYKQAIGAGVTVPEKLKQFEKMRRQEPDAPGLTPVAKEPDALEQRAAKQKADVLKRAKTEKAWMFTPREYADHPDATKVKKDSVLTEDPQTWTKESLTEKTNLDLERASLALGIAYSGNKTKKVERIMKVVEIRKTVKDMAPIDIAQKYTLKEITEMVRDLTTKTYSHLRKADKAIHVKRIIDRMRSRGVQRLAEARHYGIVKKAIEAGEKVPDNVMEHYPDLKKAPTAEGDRRQAEGKPKVERRKGERRIDAINRKRVAEMTMEEREIALLTSQKTGLKNKRAHIESEGRELEASLDIDSLKWVNDTFGHDAGDALLKKMGDALKDYDLAYHVSGDEFVLQGSQKEIDAAAADARKYLEKNPLILNGKEFVPKFSYGTAKTLKEADANMLKMKMERELGGERAERGEAPPEAYDWPEAVAQRKAKSLKEAAKDPKAYKAKLTKEVDAAIKKATEEFPPSENEYDEAEKVTIGGTFKVLNNKTSLRVFKKALSKFRVTEPTFKPSKPGVRPTGRRVTGFAGESTRPYTPNKRAKLPELAKDKFEAGFYGDGWYVARGLAIKIDKPKPRTKRELGKMPDNFIKSIAADEAAELYPAEIGLETYTSPDGSKGAELSMVRVFSTEMPDAYKKNSDVGFDPEYLDIILQTYPDAKPYLDKDGWLIFQSDGNIVAKVAPLIDQFKEAKPKAKKTPTGHADTGGYADTSGYAKTVTQAVELPEILQLAKAIGAGTFPGIVKRIASASGRALGVFYPTGKGKVDIRADLFKDSVLAAKVLSHELGHWIDYLPHKLMTRGNILGRMASLKGYMKHSLPNAPGAPGPLTDKDRARLRYQAKKLIDAKDNEVWIDEVIRKESPITPDDVMAIWRSTEGDIDPDLSMYVKKLNRAQKKAVMKDALKGVVGAELQKFAKVVETKTGKKIKQTISEAEANEMIRQKYADLINKELAKRKLFDLDTINAELKALTLAWKPFDPKADSRYTQYRFSGPELYADAFSVLINQPGMLKSIAPNFYEGFFNYMENKPEVEKAYLEVQASMNKEPLGRAKEHLDNVYKMFKESSLKRQKAKMESEKPPTSAVDFLMKHLWDKNHAVLKVARSMPDDKVHKDAKLAIQELQHTASPISAYLGDYNKLVLKELEKVGITYDELNAAAFYKRIAEGDRAQKANPLGIDQPIARRDLALIGEEIWGKEKFKKVEDVLKKFRKLREEELYPVLRESGLLTPQIMDYIEKNKHHVKWDVAEHFGKVVGKGPGGKIYKQIGTLKDIDHPITSTMLQDVSLLRAARINMAKQDILEMLKVTGDAKPARLRYSKDVGGRVPAYMPSDKGLFTVMENGKPVHYEVDSDIAAMFDFDSANAQQIVEIARVLSQPMREAFVGKNIPWMARNLVRDFTATVKNIPGVRLRHIPRLLVNYFKVMGEVRADVFGRTPSERIRDMRKRYGLPHFRTWSGKDQTFDAEIERMLTDFRVIPKADNQSNGLQRTLYQMWEFADGLGLMSEVWGKVAADRFLDTHKNFKMDGRQRAQITRELAGTPDAKQRSAQYGVLNNIFMFSEMRKAGIRQMFTAYKADKAGYIWKTLMINVLPKTFKYMMLAGGGTMALALYRASGGDDEGVEDKIKQAARIWTRIPEHDKMLYDCVPLYMTDKGKAVYLALPKDYEGQIFGTIGYLLGKYMMEESTSPTDTAKEVYKVIEQQKPYSLHALLGVIGDWHSYLKGENPEDWKGYKVVPRRVFETGDWTYIKESLPFMARHTWRSLGGGVIYKPGYADMQKREDYEKLLSTPPLNGLGTFLRFSDRGLSEEIHHRLKDYNEMKAAGVLDANQKMEALLKGGLSEKEIKDALITPGVTAKKLSKMAEKKSITDPYAKALSKADEVEKAIILNMLMEENQ